MNIENLCEILFMAAFQGIAEFLPISSSGHLAVIARLLGYNPDDVVTTSIALHAGTLVSILVFYFHSLLGLLSKQGIRTIVMIIIGTIPAGIIGVILKVTGVADVIFSYLLVCGIGFLITATLLKFGMKNQNESGASIDEMTPVQALLIGLVQGIAITPGISRSGSTIAAAMKVGLKTADCARFSFYLAIPAIGGAAFLELVSALRKNEITGSALFSPEVLIGFAVSAVVGFVALKLLLTMLNKGKLNYFSWYLYAVGAIVVVWGIIDLF